MTIDKLRIVFVEHNTVWGICEQYNGASLWVTEIGGNFEMVADENSQMFPIDAPVEVVDKFKNVIKRFKRP